MSQKTQKIKIKEQAFKRGFQLRLQDDQMEAASRSFNAAISSEMEVKRMFGTERLLHTDKAINLERAENGGLPVLYNHDISKLVGRATNIHLDSDKKLRAKITFSNNPFAKVLFEDVRSGFLQDISIGYRIERYKDIKGGIEATRWQPHEVSLCTVPVDHTVGINRTMEENPMKEQEITGTEETLVEKVGASHNSGIAEGMRMEQERANSIREMFSRFQDNPKAVELMNRCLADYRATPDYARAQLLDLLSDGYQPTTIPTHRGQERQIEVGTEDTDKFYEAAKDALMVRAGIETDPKIKDRAYKSGLMTFRLSGLAREFLKRQNVNFTGMDENMMIGESFVRISGGHSTSHFASLLEDVANKAAAKGYDEMETTWRQWAYVTSVSDFKKSNLITLSEFTDLQLMPEGSEYSHGTMKDKKEQIGVDTYGKMFSITRQAIINDDLAMLSDAPRKMGVAAARSVEVLAYGVLTGNPTLLEDSTTVFHANHNNIGSAGVPSETTIDELMKLIALQKGLINDTTLPKSKRSAAILGLRAKYIIVPIALELSVKQFFAAQYAEDALNKPNVLQNALQVIASPHLDNVSTTAYYALADQNLTDTVYVAFLNGNQSPYIDSKDGWNRDGIEYKVRIDAGAAWGDFRGAAYNAGA